MGGVGWGGWGDSGLKASNMLATSRTRSAQRCKGRGGAQPAGREAQAGVCPADWRCALGSPSVTPLQPPTGEEVADDAAPVGRRQDLLHAPVAGGQLGEQVVGGGACVRWRRSCACVKEEGWGGERGGRRSLTGHWA